jgi:hypothetical protein
LCTSSRNSKKKKRASEITFHLDEGEHQGESETSCWPLTSVILASWEDYGSRPAMAKKFVRPHLNGKKLGCMPVI